METPIESLYSILTSLEKAKDKSIKSFYKGEIDKETHLTHIKNLEPKIIEYKEAIKKLTK